MLSLIFLCLTAITASFCQGSSAGVCPTDQCKTAVLQPLLNSTSNVSSEINKTILEASGMRLTSEGCWVDQKKNKQSFVTIDLGCVQPVCGVCARGDELLLEYALDYSNDNTNWKQTSTICNETFNAVFNLFRGGNPTVIKPAVRGRYFQFNYLRYAAPEETKPDNQTSCLNLELNITDVPEDSFESMGCYLEKSGNKSLRAMPIVYHTVTEADTENPDILAIYEKCRQMAEARSPPITVFGIRNFGMCVTTQPGKEDQFSKYGRSKSCAFCRGKAIGARKFHMFVYRKRI